MTHPEAGRGVAYTNVTEYLRNEQRSLFSTKAKLEREIQEGSENLTRDRIRDEMNPEPVPLPDSLYDWSVLGPNAESQPMSACLDVMVRWNRFRADLLTLLSQGDYQEQTAGLTENLRQQLPDIPEDQPDVWLACHLSRILLSPDIQITDTTRVRVAEILQDRSPDLLRGMQRYCAESAFRPASTQVTARLNHIEDTVTKRKGAHIAPALFYDLIDGFNPSETLSPDQADSVVARIFERYPQEALLIIADMRCLPAFQPHWFSALAYVRNLSQEQRAQAYSLNNLEDPSSVAFDRAGLTRLAQTLTEQTPAASRPPVKRPEAPLIPDEALHMGTDGFLRMIKGGQTYTLSWDGFFTTSKDSNALNVFKEAIAHSGDPLFRELSALFLEPAPLDRDSVTTALPGILEALSAHFDELADPSSNLRTAVFSSPDERDGIFIDQIGQMVKAAKSRLNSDNPDEQEPFLLETKTTDTVVTLQNASASSQTETTVTQTEPAVKIIFHRSGVVELVASVKSADGRTYGLPDDYFMIDSGSMHRTYLSPHPVGIRLPQLVRKRLMLGPAKTYINGNTADMTPYEIEEIGNEMRRMEDTATGTWSMIEHGPVGNWYILTGSRTNTSSVKQY